MKIEKHKFHQHKNPISINSIDISKIIVSDKVSFGKMRFEYFIGNKDGIKVKLLCILLPTIRGNGRDFNEI